MEGHDSVQVHFTAEKEEYKSNGQILYNIKSQSNMRIIYIFLRPGVVATKHFSRKLVVSAKRHFTLPYLVKKNKLKKEVVHELS
jgi:hypothetical protein